MDRVDVMPWVIEDVTAALRSSNPGFRLVLGRVLFDLHNHLLTNWTRYQANRIPGSPCCFWYERIYANGQQLHFFSFVVRDAHPLTLDVIWVIPTA